MARAVPDGRERASSVKVVDSKLQSFARSYYVSLAAVQLMAVCLLFWGRIPSASVSTRGLTSLGLSLFRPERELSIYAFFVVAAVAVSWYLGGRTYTRSSGLSSSDCGTPKDLSTGSPGKALSIAADYCDVCHTEQSMGVGDSSSRVLWRCVIATVAAFSCVSACSIAPAPAGGAPALTAVLALLLVSTAVVIWGVAYWMSVNVPPPGWLVTVAAQSEVHQEGAAETALRRGITALDLVVAATLFVLIYIPNTSALAGADFRAQRLHHWDFFAMGPAVGFLHGGRLGDQIYSQYGVGFPMLAASVARWFPLTYAHLLRAAVFGGCIYYFGLYAFLRALLRDRRWAVFGVLSTLDLHLFHGIETGSVIWQYPSSTFLRSPFDICLFGALLLDARRTSRFPLVLASLLVGFALLFETDTGAYLALAFGAYVALTRFCGSEVAARAIDWRSLAADLRACALPGMAIAGVGLELAARGQAASLSFLRGWLEVFRIYPAGIGMLPVTLSAFGMIGLCVSVTVFVALISHQANMWRHERIGRRQALFACVALYGLCYLCQFVGRSHPYNLFHSCIPLVILAIAALKRLAAISSLARSGIQIPGKGAGRLPLILAGCAIVDIVLFSGYRSYPDSLHALTGTASEHANDVAMNRTGVRMPSSMQPAVEDFNRVTSEARGLVRRRLSVFFLVNNDPIYYLASDARSRFRYSPLFQNLLTTAAVTQFERDFIATPPDYVFVEPGIRSGPDGESAWDVRQPVLRIVESRYRFDHLCGTFEVWRHKRRAGNGFR